MKIQNMSIIFIVVIIPILMLLGYYLSLQEDTLKMQSEYNSKLSSAVKEAIKAYEINTVNWRLTRGETRRNVNASVNTFLTSLANNIGMSGTAKEYMVNYVPAVAMTMYSGYYIYSPAYVPQTIENDKGLQLYYNKTTREVTTADSTDGVLNDIIYEPAAGVSPSTGVYKYTDDSGREHQKSYNFTTDATKAAKIYKHALSNEIAYSGNYQKGAVDVTINYTLDNRVYVYGKNGTENINEQGCLVYFNPSQTNLPQITLSATPKKEDDITINQRVDKTTYNGSNINAEILTEQVAYREDPGSDVRLGTFKYIYDITNEKLYYDEDKEKFFTVDETKKVKNFLDESTSIKAGDEPCKYKSVSILTSDKTFKKIYQVLNGRDKGKWYISLKDHSDMVSEIGPDKEVIDTEIEDKILDFGLSAIYCDYSAISYYVEAYAFTNWIGDATRLGGRVTHKKVIFDEETKTYKEKTETIDNLFVITEENDMEKKDSLIQGHKRQIMIDTINSNLNLSISNYARNSEHEYKLPVLTDQDWDTVFKNISMIAFFQGVPIGLKMYNNYAIATSSLNRDYVDPDELFFTTTSSTYHRPYCTKEKFDEVKTDYKGYRSVEYSLRTYESDDKNIYYYQHTNQPVSTNTSELGCYYCIVNKANYTRTIDIPSASITAQERDIRNIQAKAYRETLARERYYQNEALAAKLGIIITYHPNLTVGGAISSVTGVPAPQEAQPNELTRISTQLPVATTNDAWLVYNCVGWSLNPSSTTIEYGPGAKESDYFTDNVDLYAVWTISLARLNWNKDFKWTWTQGDPSKDHGYFDTDGQGVAGIYDGSISHAIFKDEEGGSVIEMEGNGSEPGKGACWTDFQSEFLEISEFAFDFNVKKGDSFSAAGFMFNITETPTTLTGYLFSINFRDQFYSKAGNKSGAIYEFTYNKNSNSNLFESLTLIQALDVPTSGGSGRNGGFSGRVAIKVTNSGYLFTSNFSSDIPINTPTKTTSFGFFSEHYGHGCSDIGYFKLHNIKISVVPK